MSTTVLTIVLIAFSALVVAAAVFGIIYLIRKWQADSDELDTDIDKERVITASMFGLHLLCYTFLSLIFAGIVGDLIVGFITGLIAWGLILWKSPVMEWTFRNVQPNWVLLLSNQLKKNILPEDVDARTRMFPLASLREVGHGWQGKLPHEVVFDSVDLQKEIVMGKDEPLICSTKDNIPVKVKWQGILTPLRGYVVNLVRNGETAGVNFFRSEFSRCITVWIKDRVEDDVYKDMRNMKDMFNNLFGGPNEVDDDEKKYGMFTNDPQIFEVVRDPSYQKAAEATQVAKRTGEAARELTESFTGTEKPDPNLVLLTAASAAGNPVSNVFLIPGFRGDAKDVTALVATMREETKKGEQPKKGK